MLQGITSASPPSLRMPLATSSQASSLRLEITTLAPSRASSSAEERPMPRLGAVTAGALPGGSDGGFFIIFVSLIFRPSLREAQATKQSTLALPPYGLLRFARNDGIRCARPDGQ